MAASLMGCMYPTKAGPKDPAGRKPKRLVEVVDDNGATVAWRCSNCTALACMIGNCPGCGMRECKLPYVVETGELRAYYHTEDCANAHSKKMGAAKRDRLAKFKAAQTKIPGVE